jgi:putative hemolysin
MISSIFTFGDTLVKEIMVPRTDVSMVDVETPIDELIDFIKASGYTRYPVYRESRDEIIGFLYAKDLLRFLSEDKRQFNLQSILRDPYFVPENKEISALLKEFQKNKIHAAVVVDEYGGTAGLVTLEDILEEIVGEIQDEYDEESPLFTRISPNIIIADAKLPIDKINELLETTLLPENGDFETLGGFIYDHTGRIPEVNEAFEFKNFKFTVVEVEGQRLKKIRIEEMNV